MLELVQYSYYSWIRLLWTDDRWCDPFSGMLFEFAEVGQCHMLAPDSKFPPPSDHIWCYHIAVKLRHMNCVDQVTSNARSVTLYNLTKYRDI